MQDLETVSLTDKEIRCLVERNIDAARVKTGDYMPALLPTKHQLLMDQTENLSETNEVLRERLDSLEMDHNREVATPKESIA